LFCEVVRNWTALPPKLTSAFVEKPGHLRRVFLYLREYINLLGREFSMVRGLSSNVSAINRESRTELFVELQRVEGMPIFIVVGGTGIEPVTPAV
jgi:hypothetical protein